MKRKIDYQFYIASRSKFPYVILLILGVFTMTFYSLVYLSSTGILEVPEIAETANRLAQMTTLKIVLNFYYSDKIILFVGAFVALFSLIEFQKGYIKAVYDPFASKIQTVISKLLVILAYIVVAFVLVLVLTLISSATFLPHKGFGNIGNFIDLSLVQILVEFAFAGLIMFFSIMVRKTVWALLGTLFYIMFAPITIYSVINQLVRILSGNKAFTIARFIPYGNTYELSIYDSKTHFIMAIVSSIIFIGLGIYLNKVFYEKKDLL